MKIASFEVNGRPTYGVVAGELLSEPGELFRTGYPDLRAVLEGDALAELAATESGTEHAIGSVNFLPVIPKPDKIMCIGVNYRPHVEEMGRDIPEYPVVFARFPGSLVGHEQSIIRPQASETLDFEGELAIVIGKTARHVSRDHALDYVAGYCCFMDGSVRDWQRHTTQFTAGKNFDRSGSMGPYLVTSDVIPDTKALSLTTLVNGEILQRGELADLLFDIPALIEYCSTFTKLLPGDVIATGTPGGVGAARTPPLWLQHGDTVDVDIAGLARLSNSVRNE